MKEFLSNELMLHNATAVELYQKYAKDMPIFDFHCHLNPEDIYRDTQFSNLTQVWLVSGTYGDHYKWRIMREMGIDEAYITGDKSDYEKFAKFAQVIPYAIGNPIYLWTHLELKRYFNIDEILCPQTAEKIYNEANRQLQTMTARQMIKKFNVKTLFTTDDPIDDLKWHKLLLGDKTFQTKVAPAFRPDKAINIELATFVAYINKLGEVCGKKIEDIDTLTACLGERIAYFDSLGCVCSDHALDEVMYAAATKQQANQILLKALANVKLTDVEVEQYKGYILVYLGKQYNARKWVQQYHIGAMRNNSQRYMNTLGADTGFDAIMDTPFSKKLSQLLNQLDMTNELPKTILYSLNPSANEVLATVKNCFQASGAAAKIQFGSAWWFNDQQSGIDRQLTALNETGLISKFVGMLTDSRSFMSYPRHEFFRRLLCNRFGQLIEEGEYPRDIAFVGKVIQDICFNNADEFFTK